MQGDFPLLARFIPTAHSSAPAQGSQAGCLGLVEQLPSICHALGLSPTLGDFVPTLEQRKPMVSKAFLNPQPEHSKHRDNFSAILSLFLEFSFPGPSPPHLCLTQVCGEIWSGQGSQHNGHNRIRGWDTTCDCQSQ